MKIIKIIGTAIVLLVVAMVLVLGGQLHQFGDTEEQKTAENNIEVTETANNPDATVQEVPSATEISINVEIAEETTVPEETITTAKVVEVITQDPQTDVVVLEGKDGSKVTTNVGVAQSDGGTDLEADNKDIITPSVKLEQTDEPADRVQETTSAIEKPTSGQIPGPDMTITYQEYEAMSGQEQMLFYYSFANAEAFTEWYNAAKAEYESGMDKIYIGSDGSVDIGDIEK